MFRVNMLIKLSMAIFGMTLLSSGAFSETNKGAASVTELIKKDTKVGTGEEAVVGKMVEVHYTGWLYDEAAPDKKGAKFDSSRDRGAPFSFLLGAGRVIKGWDRGVAGMKVGGQRTLIIPPAMAYGAHGAGNVIPPNAALIFDVELLGLRQGSTH
ncbi:FKBP-type peptidyl-prolyl cis-trans isomerase [Nitrosovibrio tenuis]|uniref:Peptidyl-prolyl cis-trans isomerase n=1 Tax=Nitrosovibrio tenuis TaxID=1233 RepID=A0A1H7H7V1_9PROT|nr:FKBP-type peptidyl-prolyl cis-trans isomerase [Nitrosovibrio tenuis]SEK46476.1 FKBP-type peptidyl-prolyl cis-trans isomerase FkpA [Nitrosovibrio tenuis]